MLAAPADAGSPPQTLLESARQPLATSDPGITFGWTPDGQALALASDGSQGRWGSRIVVINADGTGLSMIPGISTALDPAWRPLPG